MCRKSVIIAVAALSISAGAAACPAFPNHTDGTSHPATPTLLRSTATSSCTPRMYWFPAECTSDRDVTSAAKAKHGTTSHAIHSAPGTCVARTYWFAAHCG
jgi:hypothetical protein